MSEYTIMYSAQRRGGPRVAEVWRDDRKVCAVPEDRDDAAFQQMLEDATKGAEARDFDDGDEEEDD